MRKLSLNAFWNLCRWLTAVTALAIGLSLAFLTHYYKGPGFHTIFEIMGHKTWAVIFVLIGVTTTVGIVRHLYIWRLGCVAHGSILISWAIAFLFSGSFHRSPPTFFVWTSAGCMSIMVALTIQPAILDKFLTEVEKTKSLIQGE